MLPILTLLYLIMCLFSVYCSGLNMLIAGKRKYNHKTLLAKCQAPEDLEKEMSSKDVAVNKEHFISLDQEQRKTFRFKRKRRQQ